MNKFVLIIITCAVSLLVKALKFIPGLTEADVDAAITEAKTQLDNAKATFAEVQSEDTLTVVVSMVDDALTLTQAALDAKGETKYDGYFATGIAFLSNLSGNVDHPIAVAIKTWFQKTFGKKA